MPTDNILRTVGIPTTPIPGRLRSVATFGGVAEAGEIIDDSMQASLSQINSEVNNKLVELEEAIQGTYTPIEVEDHLSTTSKKPVLNKVISNALNSKVGTNDIDNILTTKIGELNLVNSNYLSSNYYNKNHIDTTFATKLEISSIVRSEIDPIFTESPASQITTEDITNWNNKLNALNITALDVENGVPIATIGNTTIKAPTAGQVISLQSDWNEESTSDASYIWNKPTLLSEFLNDLNFLTPGSLTGYARTEDIPTVISTFTNDSGYLTALDISGKANIADLAAVATSGNYSDLNGIPNLSNYLPLTGGTISGELTIDNSGLEQEAYSPLCLKYNTRDSSPIITILTDYNNKLCYINFPDKTCTLASTESPMFTGNPRAVTVDNSNNSSTIATTRFVHNVIDNTVLVTNTLSEGTIVATINDTNIRVPAGNIIVDSTLDSDSEHPVQNKVISSAIATINSNFREFSSNIFGIHYNSSTNEYTSNGSYDDMVEKHSMVRTLAASFDNKIYHMDAVDTDGIDVYKFEYVRTTFDGSVYTYDKFIFTKDTTQPKGCIVTRSTNSITFNFNSVSGTLNIITTNNNNE